ncbi:Glycoprotein gp2 [hydrothermal vent metagenome]|uniref:Glycoprotein gp2 n=1 Tax=hydrothermal vent metagenome TaxID=652676 RepID=A0A3B0WCW1_9ZZZZ
MGKRKHLTRSDRYHSDTAVRSWRSNTSGISNPATQSKSVRVVIAAILTTCFVTSSAYAMSRFGGDRHHETPPADDGSGLTPLVFDPDGAILKDLPDPVSGIYEGGNTGTATDAGANNVLPADAQRDDGIFNIPTNGAPSPLYGATPFSQQMLRFEEFGSDKLKFHKKKPHHWKELPQPADAQSTPNGHKLEKFLSQRIWPTPTKFANTNYENPWERLIEDFIGRNLVDPPAEGRPPGIGWSHQRWDEFKPKVYSQTAQAGARTNGGFRDNKQLHGYHKGEFGPGGLYHNTTGNAGSEGTTEGISIRFHPNMPIQDHKSLWTFDGTLPPKLLNARYGEPVLLRHYNALPVDVAANRGFGVHTITTHEHNGHNPAESDGYANSFFFPGQFYDYRWPMTLAGTDSINTDAKDPRAAMPTANGGTKRVPGDWHETMGTHWFHDHMLDFTAQNVYKGNAAMMNYYSALDRGNEEIDDGVNLRLPSGTALGWGNRDYDVNLLLAEKAWDSEGQLWFNPFNLKGFIGDAMTVNWLYKPYMDVRARKYRFRLLNGSVSRYFRIALVDQTGEPVPFYMVANDGNLMEHTVYFGNGTLPTQGIAERYDIVVDFSNFNEGDKIYMVNLLQHKDGQATDIPIPLADVVSGIYSPETVDDDNDGTPDRWINGDPVVGKFLELRVAKYDGKDLSMNPAEYVEGGKTMIPLQRPTESELANALHRTFEFERQPTDDKPWVIETDGGKGFGMDPRRVSAAPSKNSGGLEVWRLINSGNWSHPIHIHFEEGIILRRNGLPPPEHEKWARKDVYRIGPQEDSGDIVEVALRFREFAGTYMEHCHNTQHEDHAMLLRWDIENPGQVKLMPTPIPTWDGVSYVDSVALPTFRDGDGVGIDGGIELDSLDVWIKNGVTINHLGAERIDIADIRNGAGSVTINDEFIGDEFSETLPGGSIPTNERGAMTFELSRGINIDADGNEREVFFIMHDVSDEETAEDLGVAWAGGLEGIDPRAAATAEVDADGNFTFFGDLPNPVRANPDCRRDTADDPADFGAVPGLGEVCGNPADIPDNSEENTYSPLRIVNYKGKEMVFNTIFINWGDKIWEQNRVDLGCVSLPDNPPNRLGGCAYNGLQWGRADWSGHVIDIDVAAEPPWVTLKVHKSWSGDGDYLPYYLVLDSWPLPPARAMGVPNVPKHKFLALNAVPLVQFVPGRRIHPSYPPMPQPATTDGGEGGLDDGFGIRNGGGPFGSQTGLPSYFMPEKTYSPMWHIGFAHWLKPADRVLTGFKDLKQARANGELEILEWPAPPRIAAGDNDPNGVRVDDFDFDNPLSPHIVNCPTPITIDRVIHNARNAGRADFGFPRKPAGNEKGSE